MRNREQWNYLSSDPTNIESLGLLLRNPPTITKPDDPCTSSAFPASSVSTDDVFQVLPAEIRVEILCLLPTASIRAVQLASRAMASHTYDTSIFMSRFTYPHEFSHIPISEINLPPAGSFIYWPDFLHALLHPGYSGLNDFRWGWDGRPYLNPDDLRAYKNRQRIVNITTQLAKRLLINPVPKGSYTVYDSFSTAPFRRKVLRLSSGPTTKRNRTIFTEGLQLNDVSRIMSYYRHEEGIEQRGVLTGIDFLSKDGYNRSFKSLGNNCYREGRMTLPDTVSLGRETPFSGFIIAIHDGQMVDMKPYLPADRSTGGSDNMQDSLEALSSSNDDLRFAKLTVLDGSTIHGFEMTACGDVITSLTLIEREDDARSGIHATSDDRIEELPLWIKKATSNCNSPPTYKFALEST